MRRFWIEPEHISEPKIEITGESFHHIIDVCRMEVGDRFEVMTAGSLAYFVELVQVGKKSASAQIQEQRSLPLLPRPHIHLALSIPRPQKLDFIVEKAVELGVAEVHLFTSDYSFVRDPKDFSPSRLSRLERIIKSAQQQSARGEPLKLPAAQKLKDLLDIFNRQPQAKGLFAFEGEVPLQLHSYLATVPAQNLETMWIFVGSEGGFSTREVELFRQNGLEPVTLGAQILRVETACVALVSIIKYALRLDF